MRPIKLVKKDTKPLNSCIRNNCYGRIECLRGDIYYCPVCGKECYWPNKHERPRKMKVIKY